MLVWTPIAWNCACRSCEMPSKPKPEILMNWSFKGRPPLDRMPFVPIFQPAWSRSWPAFLGSCGYMCWDEA